MLDPGFDALDKCQRWDTHDRSAIEPFERHNPEQKDPGPLERNTPIGLSL